MTFRLEQKVLFKHCDPAGIVFYPRYFEMMNDCVEAFFAEIVLWPFERIHAKGAVPAASISTDFKAPSRHGDLLSLGLSVARLGRASLGLSITADCGAERRFETNMTIVNVSEAGRPEPWPEQARQRLSDFMGE